MVLASPFVRHFGTIRQDPLTIHAGSMQDPARIHSTIDQFSSESGLIFVTFWVPLLHLVNFPTESQKSVKLRVRSFWPVVQVTDSPKGEPDSFQG